MDGIWEEYGWNTTDWMHRDGCAYVWMNVHGHGDIWIHVDDYK